MADGILSSATGREGDGYSWWQRVSIEGKRRAGGEMLTLVVRLRFRARGDCTRHGHDLWGDESLSMRETGGCGGIFVGPAERWRHADGRCGEWVAG